MNLPLCVQFSVVRKCPQPVKLCCKTKYTPKLNTKGNCVPNAKAIKESAQAADLNQKAHINPRKSIIFTKEIASPASTGHAGTFI